MPSIDGNGPEQTHFIEARNELSNFSKFLRIARSDGELASNLAPTMFSMHLRARRRANLLWGLWLFLPMALTMVIGLALQRQGTVLPATDMPLAAYATIGVAMWQSLAEALTMPLRLLTTHRMLVTRTRMPLEAPILAGLIEISVSTSLRTVCILAMLPWLGASPGSSVIQLPLFIVGLMALGLTLGLLIAPFGLLIEDANRAIVLLLALWLLVTPVAYPLGPTYTFWNPAAPLIEAGRASLTGGLTGDARVHVALSMLALLPAWLWLRLSRSNLIDRAA